MTEKLLTTKQVANMHGVTREAINHAIRKYGHHLPGLQKIGTQNVMTAADAEILKQIRKEQHFCGRNGGKYSPWNESSSSSTH